MKKFIAEEYVQQNYHKSLKPNYQIAHPIAKQPYAPPEVVRICPASIILNNLSGCGDGDAALAHS